MWIGQLLVRCTMMCWHGCLFSSCDEGCALALQMRQQSCAVSVNSSIWWLGLFRFVLGQLKSSEWGAGQRTACLFCHAMNGLCCLFG